MYSYSLGETTVMKMKLMLCTSLQLAELQPAAIANEEEETALHSVLGSTTQDSNLN